MTAISNQGTGEQGRKIHANHKFFDKFSLGDNQGHGKRGEKRMHNTIKITATLFAA
jgi:hypothetical protein